MGDTGIDGRGVERFIERDRRLAELMGRLVDRDGDAFGQLVDEFHAEFERVVVGLARHRGASLAREEVEGLVLDAALDVADMAGGWRSDGAPPWHWARHRIANRVDERIGQWADPLDGGDGRGDASPRGSASAPSTTGPGAAEGDVIAAVGALALRDPLVALLDEAVRSVATDRDRRLFYETLAESVAGTRAHADVVARLHGLAPTTVRQQIRRVRLRLRHLVETDERYAPLAELRAVA